MSGMTTSPRSALPRVRYDAAHHRFHEPTRRVIRGKSSQHPDARLVADDKELETFDCVGGREEERSLAGAISRRAPSRVRLIAPIATRRRQPGR